jgi:hypothetical protein
VSAVGGSAQAPDPSARSRLGAARHAEAQIAVAGLAVEVGEKRLGRLQRRNNRQARGLQPLGVGAGRSFGQSRKDRRRHDFARRRELAAGAPGGRLGRRVEEGKARTVDFHDGE